SSPLPGRSGGPEPDPRGATPPPPPGVIVGLSLMSELFLPSSQEKRGRCLPLLRAAAPHVPELGELVLDTLRRLFLHAHVLDVRLERRGVLAREQRAQVERPALLDAATLHTRTGEFSQLVREVLLQSLEGFFEVAARAGGRGGHGLRLLDRADEGREHLGL